MHKYAYVHGDPISVIDPTGEFSLGGLSVSLAIGVAIDMTVPGPADFILGAFESLVSAYAANLAYDVVWAVDTTQPDSWTTRSDNAWVLAAITQGLHDAFAIETPFGTINLLDIFEGAANISQEGTASALSAMARKPTSRARPVGRRLARVSRSRFGASVNGVFTTRAGAFNSAKDRAGIPTSQVPERQWTIRGSHLEHPSGATVRNPDPTHQGRIYEFKVRGDGGRVEYRYMVVHERDPTHGGIGHVHLAESKRGPTYRLSPGEKYLNVDKHAGLDPVPFARIRSTGS